MSIRAFIFDMDGTMIHSMPYHAQSWVVFCERHGIDMPIQEVLRRTTGRNGAECMSELFGREIPAAQAWELVAEKEAIYREIYTPHFQEVRGFRAFAEKAQAHGLAWGVGTAGDQHNIHFAMTHLQLREAPAVIVGGDQGLRGKPEPDIFLQVAHLLNVPAAHCLVFEDAPLGIEAARRAGMRAVGLCTTHRAEELQGPHVLACANDFQELHHHSLWETLHAA